MTPRNVLRFTICEGICEFENIWFRDSKLEFTISGSYWQYCTFNCIAWTRAMYDESLDHLLITR